MKTILAVTITSALVLFFVARAPSTSAQAPVALSGSEAVPIDSPVATLDPPPIEAAAPAPVPAPRKKAPATAQNFFARPVGAPGGLPSVKVAAGAPKQWAVEAAPLTPAQMLLQSEIKVMRRHYENVLQRALEAEEKSQLATIGADGNPKPQPDADAALHRDRATVLRRYAEQLQDAITAKASDPNAREAMARIGGDTQIAEGTTPVRSATPDATAEYKRALKQYPVLGVSNAPGTTRPPNYTEEFANKMTVLGAQLRAQQAALSAGKIDLEEAMDDLKRAEAAYEQKTISAEEMSHKKYAMKKAQARLDKMEAEMAATEAERAMAKAQLDGTRAPAVTAPPLVSPARPPGVSSGTAPSGIIPGAPSSPETPGTPPSIPPTTNGR